MSAVAEGAALIFGLWLLASIGYVLPLPRIHARLARLNRFRTFCGWALFVEVHEPARYGAYSLEYRDDEGGLPGEWIVATANHSTRVVHLFLKTDGPIATGFGQVAGALEDAIAAGGSQVATANLRRLEHVLAQHIAATHPATQGSAREIRLVKRFGSRLAARDTVVWSFRNIHD